LLHPELNALGHDPHEQDSAKEQSGAQADQHDGIAHAGLGKSAGVGLRQRKRHVQQQRQSEQPEDDPDHAQRAALSPQNLSELFFPRSTYSIHR